MVQHGDFLEYARVFGKHSYGTPKKWLEESRKKDSTWCWRSMCKAPPRSSRTSGVRGDFYFAPSREELERRLRSRGQDSGEEIARRLARARDEIAEFGKYYDYCVVNDDVERAGREVQAIVNALRCSSAASARASRKTSGVVWRERLK